jgi:hypothetical protein
MMKSSDKYFFLCLSFLENRYEEYPMIYLFLR